jgi:nucleotide-binding universal stress UspA family protein
VYRNILVPIDGSATARLGLDEAIGLAKSQGSRIRLVYVINELPLVWGDLTGATYPQVFERTRDYGASVLDDAQKAVRAAGIDVDSKILEAPSGPAGEPIVAEAAAWPADLIVCGTHGRRGLRRIVMGSDAEFIVRQSPVPVLLVRARSTGGG